MLLPRRPILIILSAVIAAFFIYLLRVQLILLLRLLLGGMVLAYVLLPVSRLLEEKARLNRSLAIIGAMLMVLAALVLIALLFLPPLISQMRELISALPAFTDSLRLRVRSVNDVLSRHGFSRLSLPDFKWDRVLSSLPPILGGTASLAGSVVSVFTDWTLILMLGYYFLRDRERLMLHLELLVPASVRLTALRMASAVHQEIGAFFRGQLLISAIIAGLSALGLMLSGVRAFLPLGLIIGIFNMIPYFGPILGAIPAVLMALTQGLSTAMFAALSLFTVQQLDGMIISPRIMGALTGLHPAGVLLAITLGSSLWGLIGMLLAIPFLLTTRAISRVWMSRSEEKQTT